MTSIIRTIIRFRFVMWALVGAGILFTVYSIRTASLDAIPDISDPQIVIYAKWPRSPQILERDVTEPVIRALNGSPGIQTIRGTSHMGFSFIYVVLNDPAQRSQ